MIKNLLLSSFFLFTHFCFAQNGTWNPVGAHTEYPRTMLKSSDLEEVRNTLSEASIQELYSGVVNSAFNNVPAGNTSSNDRRLRAGIAKNAGFVLLMGKKIVNGNAVDITVDEKALLQIKVIGLLEEINTDVESLISFTEWQWRSKELIDYAIAYDMLKGKGIEDIVLDGCKMKLQELAGNLYEESTKVFLGYSLFNNIKNNHALMTAAALGIAAVVINDAESIDEVKQPQRWIEAAMWNIDNILWRDEKRQSEPGEIAGFAEGPYYFRYAFINCLPFFRAMGNFLEDNTLPYTFNLDTRNIRNPYYDPDYENLYEWMRIIRMPDGRMPALDDSFIDMAMPELALTGKPKYNWPLNFENLPETQNNTLSKQLNVVVDLRANYIAANTHPESFKDTTFQALPMSGNVVFRSSGNADATYMHLHAESGRALSETDGHNQADETSFIIHSHGQLLALDPGYLSYGRRTELGNARNHNMILVNGAGPEMGFPGNTNGAEVFIEDAFSHNNFSSAELTASYSGADIKRRIMFIRNKYFIMMDAMSSSTNADFQWQLHGYGLENGNTATGTYTENTMEQKGYYSKNGVTLLAQVTAENGISSFGKRMDQHEIGYNNTEDHTTMLINKNDVQNTSFISLLAPFTTETLISELVLNTPAAAIKIQDDNYNDFAFSRTNANSLSFTGAETGLNYGIGSDASSLFYSENKEGDILQYFLTKSTHLKLDDSELFKSDNTVNFCFIRGAEDAYTIQIDEAATVSLAFDFQVASVIGNDIQSWNYDPQDKVLNISFSEASIAQIKLDLEFIPEIPTGIASKRLKSDPFRMYPNPASDFVFFSLEGKKITSGLVIIMDVNGKEIRHFTISDLTNFQVDISNISNGIYYCRFIHENLFSTTKKLIIQSKY